MDLFDTWLGFFGLVGGLVTAAVWRRPPVRSALIGFALGIAAVIVANLMAPTTAPCLQSAKGGDILRAFRLCG